MYNKLLFYIVQRERVIICENTTFRIRHSECKFSGYLTRLKRFIKDENFRGIETKTVSSTVSVH